MKSKKNKGFTLVELVVTLTIMAILTAIAWPLYSQQKAKAQRQDCIAGLSGAIQAMEEWNNTTGKYNVAGMNNYKAAVSNTNLQACQQRGYQTNTVDPTGPFATCANVCSITATIPNSADSYILTATRVYNSQTPDSNKDRDCNVFYLDSQGKKAAITLAIPSEGKSAVDSTLTPSTADLKKIRATCWLEN